MKWPSAKKGRLDVEHVGAEALESGVQILDLLSLLSTLAVQVVCQEYRNLKSEGSQDWRHITEDL